MNKAPTLLAILDPLGYGDRLERWTSAAQAARLPAVLARDRERSDRDRLRALVELRRAGLSALASARPDLALATGVSGVHLPADGLATALVRQMLGHGRFVGRSTHTFAEVEAAALEGADYVVFGPIWATPGKGAGVGLGALARACRLGVPVLALGGVVPARFGACAAAGASGVAGIRFCAEPGSLEEAVAEARRVFS